HARGQGCSCPAGVEFGSAVPQLGGDPAQLGGNHQWCRRLDGLGDQVIGRGPNRTSFARSVTARNAIPPAVSASAGITSTSGVAPARSVQSPTQT
ncbi:MAG: hypothetical protein ACRDSM_16235, partial [Pseudonocardiaceae bacterium]